ncbi:MAG: NADAR family protein [Candidatus Helarchaeota archaeon]
MVNIIKRFSGKYSFLSNFYPCKIIYENICYPSVEHAYQASKTLDINLRKEIASQKTPALAKKLGRAIKLRSDWDRVKLSIMETLVRLKFTTNEELKKKIIELENCILIEGNTWGDTFWGVYNGNGKNHLGKILMKVRDDLIRKNI